MAKIHLKSGKVKEMSGYACELTSHGISDEVGDLDISDIRDFHSMNEITGIEFYLNGKKQKESPPIWTEGQGYIFSEKGLERTIPPKKGQELLADYHTNEDTRKLCEICHSLTTKENIRKLQMAFDYTQRHGINLPEEVESVIKYFDENEDKIQFDQKMTMNYNDFLSSILNEQGLEHGYNLFAEGTYIGHRIFEKNSIEKNPFLKRIFRPNLWGQLYSVNTIAQFTEEPWFNATEGCISDKVARIQVINPDYSKSIENILEEIKNYSNNVHKRSSYRDKKEPIILSYA